MSTLEQELEQLITDADYRVIVRGGEGLIRLTLIYMPKLAVRGEGAFSYIANGEIGQSYFGGRRKWKKARKWVIETIEGHRELIKTVAQL